MPLRDRFKPAGALRRLLAAFSAVALALGFQAGCGRAQPAPGGPYVQVSGGRFYYEGRPFVLRGANYSGSFRSTRPFVSRDGAAQVDVWDWLHEWNVAAIGQDMAFLRRELNATTLRIPLPAKSDWANDVRSHGFTPWYQDDGAVEPEYAAKLVQLAQIAQKNGLHLQFCLLWEVAREIQKDPDSFRPGTPLDQFYSRQVRSVAAALSGQPAVLGYSIGNEVLVKWPINGRARSWYEPRAAGFMLRRLRDVRAAAPRQLLTTDENVVGAPGWFYPSPVLVDIPDEDQSNGGRPIRLADAVDYIGGHFYPKPLTPETADDGGLQDELARTLQRESDYLRVARATGKPVVFNEFGLQVVPQVQEAQSWHAARAALFEKVLTAGQREGLQGALAWGVLPKFRLEPGRFQVTASEISPSSPTEIDLSGEASFRRIIMYQPNFDLFEFDASGALRPTAAARALAAAWPGL